MLFKQTQSSDLISTVSMTENIGVHILPKFFKEPLRGNLSGFFLHITSSFVAFIEPDWVFLPAVVFELS